ncbi:uncharacterized protein CLUP02_06751 [Colletotrichum lupini]|uniref:Uncharacterized protein n=1 Tax=Colletotrichum lupini TaxID=145971 RepID=A0A9Q8SQL2_9PEZI|nr:uncharacterized protein CLUP02_06751 [Colletotrichum lupini]UQC81265.1 hypothetical protein CLUP02_06751 [Colletotrichum lupini]
MISLTDPCQWPGVRGRANINTNFPHCLLHFWNCVKTYAPNLHPRVVSEHVLYPVDYLVDSIGRSGGIGWYSLGQSTPVDTFAILDQSSCLFYNNVSSASRPFQNNLPDFIGNGSIYQPLNLSDDFKKKWSLMDGLDEGASSECGWTHFAEGTIDEGLCSPDLRSQMSRWAKILSSPAKTLGLAWPQLGFTWLHSAPIAWIFNFKLGLMTDRGESVFGHNLGARSGRMTPKMASIELPFSWPKVLSGGISVIAIGEDRDDIPVRPPARYATSIIDPWYSQADMAAILPNLLSLGCGTAAHASELPVSPASLAALHRAHPLPLVAHIPRSPDYPDVICCLTGSFFICSTAFCQFVICTLPTLCLPHLLDMDRIQTSQVHREPPTFTTGGDVHFQTCHCNLTFLTKELLRSGLSEPC